MNARPALSIPFAADDAAETPDPRVTLETDPRLSHSAAVYPADIDQMLARARSGMSAFSYLVDRCRAARFRADGVLTLRLSCLVWPSRPDLRYELILPEDARLDNVEPLRLSRNRNFWTAGARFIEMPWCFELGRAVWREPGCFDGRSVVKAPTPDLRVEGARVFVGAEDAHGVVGVSGAAVGFRHWFELDFAKFDAENDRVARSFDLDFVPVVARWTGADGESAETALDVPVPDCAKSLLITCRDGRMRVRGVTLRPVGVPVTEIAYSTCTGRVLERRIVWPVRES